MGKLADKLKAKHADRSGKNRHRVNFLAHKADIAEAIREGWSVKQIWQQMLEDGQITMYYSSFCTLVRREIPLIGENKTTVVKERSAPAAPAESEKVPKKSENETTQETPPEKLSEDERLELLKKEAFASVRQKKPTGPLIVKPLSREGNTENCSGRQRRPFPPENVSQNAGVMKMSAKRILSAVARAACRVDTRASPHSRHSPQPQIFVRHDHNHPPHRQPTLPALSLPENEYRDDNSENEKREVGYGKAV